MNATLDPQNEIYALARQNFREFCAELESWYDLLDDIWMSRELTDAYADEHAAEWA